MARAMYDYTIEVLEKVSFDQYLFDKEVKKAFKLLLPHEVQELKIFLNHFTIKKPQLADCLSNN